MCISPIMVVNNNVIRKFSHHSVPCGRCYQCRLRRGAAWAFRLLQEKKLHAHSAFVTYTYTDDNLPYVGEAPTLVKRDLQLYFKKLRYHTGAKIKYYACGEYGTRTYRPHYHAILFGCADVLAVADTWSAGSVRIDPVTSGSIGYVTGYVNKPFHKFSDGRLPEFSLMSKGIGQSYLTAEMVKYHRDLMASFVTLQDGVKLSLPRYYRDKIFDKAEREKLSAVSEAKYELMIVETLLKDIKEPGFYHELQHNEREAVKAAIRKQSNNLNEKRNKL